MYSPDETVISSSVELAAWLVILSAGLSCCNRYYRKEAPVSVVPLQTTSPQEDITSHITTVDRVAQSV
jgi:hypothetical protein